MKPGLRILVTVVAALVAGVLLLRGWRARTEGDAARLERAQLKRELLERAAPARQLAAARQKEWLDEVRSLTHWYFDEAAAIRNRHPGEKPASADGARREGRKGKEDGTAQEFQRYTEARFASLRDGRYEARFSGADQGLHLDLLEVAPDKHPATGERALRIDFALWGAPRRVDRELAPGSSRPGVHVSSMVAFKQLAFRFSDASAKPYGEMTGAGEPYLKIVDPERWVEDFPPGVLFGSWYVDLFPAEAARVEIDLALEQRGVAGGDVPASFKWEIPVEDGWKLRAGETYQAETREVAPK